MNQYILISCLLTIVVSSCNNPKIPSYQITGEQSQIIADMIEAVNEKDAAKYVLGFADHVEVFVESDLKVSGVENLQKNRARHFLNHPDVRSEIQHILEIDHRVILHDKVWLDPTDQQGQDIVEIFTFENGKVARVDVIQPKDLFAGSR